MTKGFELVEIDGETVAVRSPEWIKNNERKVSEVRYRKAGIAKTKWELDFDTYQGEDSNKHVDKLRKFVTNFHKAHGVNLYLWSTMNSTQKSTMASVVGMRLIDKGLKVRFILMSTLTTHLQNENFEEESKAYVEDISDADFLIIDDAFDSKKATMYKSGYQISFIDTFLRKRLEVDCLNTCFTSNIPIDDLKETYGPHIYALIERHVSLPMAFNEPFHDFNPDEFWS